MGFDALVHARLRHRRLIRLVVPTSSITDQVNHNVFIELVAIVDRHLGHKHHRFRVVAVHMKNGRLHHLGDIRAVLGRARIRGLTGCEANLIVQHNMQRAAGPIGAGLRHLEGLHDHALTRKGGVTMDHDRHHRITNRVFAPVLPGSD